MACTYFFADYIFGTLWSFDYNGTINNFTNRSTELDPPGALAINNPASFGEDANGEIYIVDYTGGEIFRIIAPIPIPMVTAFPMRKRRSKVNNPNDPIATTTVSKTALKSSRTTRTP